jgi:DNA invertase Pin-like site-specific DNA recombinase
VAAWLNGGTWQLVDEVIEIESGKSHRNRPALQKALDACRRFRARLIISRPDRLSRDPVFLLSLRDAGIEFVAVDMPHANRMTVGVMALVAEQEREAISSRTKAALAAAKARGVRLGTPKPERSGFTNPAVAAAAHAQSASVRAEQANEFAELMRPLLNGELANLSANAAAIELNQRGVQTPRGGQWTARSVLNVRSRLL